MSNNTNACATYPTCWETAGLYCALGDWGVPNLLPRLAPAKG